jgi:hypothetical protein
MNPNKKIATQNRVVVYLSKISKEGVLFEE